MKHHLLILLLILLSFSLSSYTQSQWQREFEAIVNGDTLSGAYAGGLQHARIKLVDIDADSDLDVLISNYWYNEGVTKIVFYRNDGTPEKPKWIFVTDHFNELSIRGQVLSINFVDIDADSDYDLLAGAYEAPSDSGELYYYRNDGSETSPHFTYITDDYGSLGLRVVIPTFIDIDADSDLDMFIGVDQFYLYLYRNNGSPFSPVWMLVSDNYDSIKIGDWNCPNFCDIDADGDYDLLVYFRGRWNSDSLAFYRNIGNPKIPIWSLESDQFTILNGYNNCIPEFADVDNDGDFDIFLNGQYSNTIHFFRNQGNKSIPNFVFESDQLFNIPIRGTYPTFVDIDNDQDYDLFIGGQGWNNGLCFYRNDGNVKNPCWTLVKGVYDTIGVQPYENDPRFVDIDADGDFDLFISSPYHTKYYRNDGNGFCPIWTVVTDDFFQETILESKLAFVDIDADSDYDLFIGDFGGWLYYYENDGDAHNYHFDWDSTFNLGDFGNFVNPALSDLDNDGDYDLVVNAVSRDFWMQYSTGHVYVFRNDGTPQQFSFVYDPIQTSHFYNMVRGFQDNPAFIDIDDDGDMDVFKNFNDGLVFYRNTLISSDVNEKTILQDLPNTFRLTQNYPNPFNIKTVIKYFVPDGYHDVTIKIYDLLGKEVMTLIDNKQSSGEYSLVWNGKDKQGKEVSSGLYLYTLRAEDQVLSEKMLLVR